MAESKGKSSAAKRWDDESNEAQNSFVSWSAIGDFVYGTLIGVKEVKSTLADRAGQMQKVYDIKVDECEYHVLDDRKRLVDEAVVLNPGDIVSVGGRSTIDSRMARIKVGQKVGLKYSMDKPPKQKGFNPAKIIRVFQPRIDGKPVIDQEFLDDQSPDVTADGDFGI